MTSHLHYKGVSIKGQDFLWWLGGANGNSITFTLTHTHVDTFHKEIIFPNNFSRNGRTWKTEGKRKTFFTFLCFVSLLVHKGDLLSLRFTPRFPSTISYLIAETFPHKKIYKYCGKAFGVFLFFAQTTLCIK